MLEYYPLFGIIISTNQKLCRRTRAPYGINDDGDERVE